MAERGGQGGGGEGQGRHRAWGGVGKREHGKGKGGGRHVGGRGRLRGHKGGQEVQVREKGLANARRGSRKGPRRDSRGVKVEGARTQSVLEDRLHLLCGWLSSCPESPWLC